MGVWGTREHGFQQTGIQDVFRAGQVLGHLLFDGPPFLAPQRRVVRYGAHANGLEMENHVQIFGRHGGEILRHGLAGVGIDPPPHGGGDVGQLCGRQGRAAAEHHVLLGVGRSGKPVRRLVRAHEVVDHGGDHRRDRVGYDDHPQPVIQRGTDDRLPGCRAISRPTGQGGHDQHGRRNPGQDHPWLNG